MANGSASILQQPQYEMLGKRLVDELRSSGYTDFRFTVAYARMSGVNLLKPYLEEFASAGNAIYGTVGIDQRHTSIEAIETLSELCTSLFVYHNENPFITFHNKAYMLSSSSKYWLAVGSNNMTEGGLISNDEVCAIIHDETEPPASYRRLFDAYSNLESGLCLRVNGKSLKELIDESYIVSEASLRARNAESIKRDQAQSSSRRTLFASTEAIAPPKIAILYDGPSQASKSARTKPVDDLQGTYLLRYIPKAGDRTQQVHFSIDIRDTFFGLNNDDQLLLQQYTGPRASDPALVEQRKVVFSERNRNVKIEIGGAAALNSIYPSDASKRPILLMKRVSKKFYRYLILMYGNPGYDNLHNRIEQEPKHGNALKYAIVDAAQLYTVWSDCPLLN